MSVSTVYDFKMEVNETLALDLDLADDQTFKHTIADSGTLSASTTPAVSKAWADEVAMTAGALTLDLTALSMGDLPNVDFSGLKVQMFKIKAPSTNGAAVTIADGATNGYQIFGDASGQATLDPGDVIMWKGSESLPDVGGSAKEIDISGTGTDKLQILMIAG